MPLSPFVRNLISRGTALLVGLALGRACIYFVVDTHQTILEHPERVQMTQRELDRTSDGVGMLVAAAVLSGLFATCFIGFALLPTSVLYSLRVGPPRDPRDDADMLEQLGRQL